jgi:hypothetical protein
VNRPLAEQRAELVSGFTGPDSTATFDEHTDRALSIVAGNQPAPAGLLAQATAQVLGESR